MTRSSFDLLLLGLNYAPEPSGNAPYTASLARGLVERGDRVSVVSAHPHYPAWKFADGYGQWSATTVEDSVRVQRLRHYLPARPQGARRLLSELSFGLRLLTQRIGRADVVLLVSPALFSSAVALLRFPLRHPTVLWVQDLYSLGVAETGAGGAFVQRFVTVVERWAVRRASHVVVIHDRFRAHMTEVLGVPVDGVTVRRNWSHLEPVEAGDRAAARRRLGWSDDETIVLHAGNQGAKQGLGNVVQAARLADEREEPVRFVLLGDGHQRSILERDAVGVQRIGFLYPLPGDEYQEAMAAADVLLVNELAGVAGMAVPSKLTSYYTAGKPVLAATSSESVTASEVNASGAGIVVSPEDPLALLEGALALRNDAARSSALGESGRRFVHEVLDQDVAIDDFRDLLHSFAHRTSSRTSS